MIFELCTDSVEGAKAADVYGFKRIELCSALSEGGLTPSIGLIKQCAKAGSTEVHVMIRTSGGNFTCDPDDLKVMKEDIVASAEAGALGVVFGILTASNQIDSVNRDLVQLAHSVGLQTTFHRAFDLVDNSFTAMDILIEMGFDRLLSSGKQPTAIEGRELIADLVTRYGEKIEIMAGSGVNEFNALELASTGLNSLHFTARKPDSVEISLGMGQGMTTDPIKIESILKLFN